MPRQVDLTPQNMQLTHDPNNQIGMSTSQLAAFQAQQPALVAKALATSINMLLKGFTDQINLDLKAFADGLAALFPGASNVVEAFIDWLNQLSPELTELQEDFRASSQAFTTLLQGAWTALTTDTDFATLINDLQSAWNTYASAVAGIQADETLTLQKIINKIFHLDASGKMDVSWLTGMIDTTQLTGQLEAALITGGEQNQLWNPDFHGAISMSAGSGWSWSAVHFTDALDPSAGSAMCTADGVLHALQSNPIPVQPNQQVPVDVHVLTSGLVVTGTPIRVDIIESKTSSAVGETLGATVTPAGLQMGAGTESPALWTNPPAGSMQGKLVGVYTAPGDDSVNQIRLRLVVDTGATAGGVWFGNASATLSGGLIADLKNDQELSSQAFATLMNSWYVTCTTAGLSWTQLWSQLESAWQVYVTTNTAIVADEWATLNQLVGSVFGLDTATGEIPQSRIADLESSGQNWDAAYDNLHNFLLTWNWSDLTHAWTDLNTALWGGSSGSVGSTVQASAIPNLPTSQITGLDAQLNDLFNDISTAVTTGDWTDLLNDLFGTGSIQSTVQQSAIPGGIPQSKITDLEAKGQDWDAAYANLSNFLTTWSWTDLTAAWTDLNAAIWGDTTGAVGSTVQQGAIPTGISQAKVDGLPDVWTQINAAFNGDAADSGDWAWMAGLVNDWNALWTGTRSDATDSKNKLAARNNSPTYEGLDDTTSANMPLASVSLGASPIGSTEIVFIRLKQDYPADTPLRAVGFIAVASAEPTTFYVNLRTFDPDTGALKFHAGSTNINALIPVSSSADDSDWVQYDFGADNALTGNMGDLVAVEFQSSGTSAKLAGRSIVGTLNQQGAIPVHPTKKLKNYAADVTKASYPLPSTIDLASADYVFHGDNLPYVALEITGVTSDPVVQPDRPASYTTSSSLTPPSWVTHVDLVGVGAGGGGQHTVLSVNGVGGDAGNWNGKTLVVGTDIAVGGTITISVGAGGSGGAFVQNGSTGGSTTFTWKNPAGQTKTLVATGGFGGGAGAQVTSFGEGAGDYTWNSRTYYGGAAQANNAAGNPPGGGGAGGVAFTANGKDGARGQAWTVERQS